MRTLRNGFRLAAALTLALFLAGAVRAAPVSKLYDAKVEIADRSESTRGRVLEQALAQVIEKITGSARYLDDPTIRQGLADADRYLQAYSYSTALPDKTYLNARFGSSAINRLLQDAGIPIWPANRPEVLVWLVSKDFQTGTQLVLPEQILSNEADFDQPALTKLTDAAQSLGLPVELPEAAFNGESSISAEQLWALNSDAIMAASEPFNADGVLVGRVTATSTGNWRIGWWYRQGEKYEVFDSSNADLYTALREGMASLTTYLSSIYSVTAGSADGQGLAVTITGVTDFQRYAKTINYLDQLATVARYDLREVERDRLLVTLFLNGDYNTLTTALALDKVLEPVPDAASSGASSAVELRWLGP